MSDDSPTKVLPTTTSGTASFGSGPTRPRSKPPSRGPFIAFIVLAVVLVAAVVVLANILISRANAPVALPTGTPTTSAPSPSNDVSPTPTFTIQPTPVVQPAGSFTTFAAAPTGRCDGRGRRDQQPNVQVTWGTLNATQVWVGTGTGDPVGVGEQVPLAGDQDSFPTPLTLHCNGQAQEFTMTLVGADGGHVSHTWSVTVTRQRG